MAETFTRKGVENQRVGGKSEEENMRGIMVRFAKARETNPELTVDDIGTDKFKLRKESNRDTVIQGIRKESAKMAKFTVVQDTSTTVVKEPVESLKRELSQEDAEKTLNTLKKRFEENMYLHEGVEWKEVEAALRNDQKALWSVNQMQEQGHDPDVYDSDDEGFDIGTCSEETPESGKNCVYDKEAAESLKKENPDAKFNGSAVEQAKAMGIKVMLSEKYKNVLQKKGEFDKKTWSLLLTDENTRKAGDALFGSRFSGNADVYQNVASIHGVDGAWRGSLRVLWV